MLRIKVIASIFICFLGVINLFSQVDTTISSVKLEYEYMSNFNDELRSNSIRVMFYNMENLYDTDNDSLTNDDDFTPNGMNNWSKYRYWKKINNQGKVIATVGGWDAPEIVGMCEIENDKVIKDLIYYSPLKKFKYRYVHYDSPDNRGIDVAMLYRPDKFRVISSRPLKVQFTNDTISKTRDILYVCGQILASKDTLHILINHWPSRYGGYAATIDKRNQTADIVRSIYDSIMKSNINANVLIMGDLNDYPSDESLINHLKALPDTNNSKSTDLINLMYPIHNVGKIGSHKYQEHWGILDQIIVSHQLAKHKEGLRISKDGANIYRADFLLLPDETFMGVKVNRTFIGTRYNGGYSDHLPVYVDLEY